jgi:hypothetical protein
MRHTPMRSTPIRYMPMRHMPARYMPMRCMPMRYTPIEIHAHEMHAHEMHACEMYAHEVHAHEVHAHEMHARGSLLRRCLLSGEDLTTCRIKDNFHQPRTIDQPLFSQATFLIRRQAAVLQKRGMCVTAMEASSMLRAPLTLPRSLQRMSVRNGWNNGGWVLPCCR